MNLESKTFGKNAVLSLREEYENEISFFPALTKQQKRSGKSAAGVIDGSMPFAKRVRGGNGAGQWWVLDKVELFETPRSVTLAEGKILQGCPPEYKLVSHELSEGDRFQSMWGQIGNGVTVPVATAIGQCLLASDLKEHEWWCTRMCTWAADNQKWDVLKRLRAEADSPWNTATELKAKSHFGEAEVASWTMRGNGRGAGAGDD